MHQVAARGDNNLIEFGGVRASRGVPSRRQGFPSLYPEQSNAKHSKQYWKAHKLATALQSVVWDLISDIVVAVLGCVAANLLSPKACVRQLSMPPGSLQRLPRPISMYQGLAHTGPASFVCPTNASLLCEPSSPSAFCRPADNLLLQEPPSSTVTIFLSLID